MRRRRATTVMTALISCRHSGEKPAPYSIRGRNPEGGWSAARGLLVGNAKTGLDLLDALSLDSASRSSQSDGPPARCARIRKPAVARRVPRQAHWRPARSLRRLAAFICRPVLQQPRIPSCESSSGLAAISVVARYATPRLRRMKYPTWRRIVATELIFAVVFLGYAVLPVEKP